MYLALLFQFWVARWGMSSSPSHSTLIFAVPGLWPVVVVSLVRLVASLAGGFALFPLFWLVCLCVWSWCLSWWFLGCLVLSCGCPPLWPPLPWADQWFWGFSSVVSVWISGCFCNGPGVWPVCLISRLLLTGLEMVCRLLPCVFVLYGSKGFGPVWGTALYTMLCLAFCGLWLPPLSRLHVAPRHHSLRCKRSVRPPPRRTLLISLPVSLCLSWALLRCRPPFFACFLVWRWVSCLGFVWKYTGLCQAIVLDASRWWWIHPWIHVEMDGLHWIDLFWTSVIYGWTMMCGFQHFLGACILHEVFAEYQWRLRMFLCKTTFAENWFLESCGI